MTHFWDSDAVFPLLHLAWQIVLLLVLLDMTQRRRSPAGMIAWFLVIFAVPYVGVLFYLVLGRRKLAETPFKIGFAEGGFAGTPGEASFESVLRRSGIPEGAEGNDVLLYADAEAALDAVTEAIENAQHSIRIATYILKRDAVTRTLFTLLERKAAEGKDVRLLIDAFGSFPLYLLPGRLRKLEAAGVRIAFFMPLRPFWRNFHFNLRLHRKMFLVDGRTVFAGGMNISNDYFGSAGHPARWKDLLFRIDGPAAARYGEIFASDWNFSDEMRPVEAEAFDGNLRRGGERVQVVPSGPDVAADALYDALVDAFYNAGERIWIVTPYFIPDEAMIHALRTARLKGVQVRLITPERSDHYLFELGRSSYMREIAEWECEVLLYRRRMLHAKAILIDDAVGIAGSLNLDQRSLFLNYEVVSVFYNAAALQALEAWMESLTPQTRHGMPPAGKRRRVLENLGRILAPQL